MFRVKRAETNAELEGVYALRHRVFVEEERYLPARPDARITDTFDELDRVANIVAIHGGRVVGSVRCMEDCGDGTAADEYFDFAQARPDLARGAGARVCAGNWMAVERDARRVPRLVFAMMSTTYRWCIEAGMTYIKASINPAVQRGFEAVGFRSLGPPFFDERHGVPTVPVLIDLREIREPYASMIQQHQFDHGLVAFERQFHAAGEPIACNEDEVFLVVAGEVALKNHDGATIGGCETGDLLHPGLGPLTAVTEVDLMVLTRRAFAAQVAERRRVANRMRASESAGSR